MASKRRRTPRTRHSKGGKAERNWLALPDFDAAFSAAAIDRFEAEQDRLESSKNHDRIQRAWRNFYARDANGNCDTTTIAEAGKSGEVLLLQPNRYARLIRDHVTLIEQTPSNPEPIAANTDAQSQRQTQLGRSIIEHYKRESDLESIKKQRAFVAELCGDSYLHVPWDPNAGRERLAMPTGTPTGEPSDDESELDAESEPDASESESDDERSAAGVVYEGDFQFRVHSVYDIARDRTSPDPKKPRWTIVRSPVSKWDLLEQIRDEVEDPELLRKLEHAILSAEPWSKRLNALDYDDDDDVCEYDDSIAVYYVYGDRCRSRPQGRYAIVIDAKTEPFIDGPLGEPRIPVFRLSQGDVLFRNEATTANHDGLPLADALGAQMSTILSNNANHGLQRTTAARKANLDHRQIDSGAAVVEYDHVDEAGNPIPPPVPWTGPSSAPELYEFYRTLCAELDLVMAGSPVTRGDPRATQGDSGSKVAALFTAAQNVQSSFVAEVLRSDAEVYSYLIESLRHHATLPRVIMIAGKNNTYTAVEYVGGDIEGIERVQVSQADPMRDTIQGRLAVIELLKDQSPEQQKQTVAVLQTGRIEVVTDPMESHRLLIESENEELRDPTKEQPPVCKGDQHAEHIAKHLADCANMITRRDPVVRGRFDEHVALHVAALTPSSPAFIGIPLCAATGQTPLPDPNAPVQGAEGAESPADQARAQPGAPPPAPSNGAPNIPPKPGMRAGTPGAQPGMPDAPDMPDNPITGQKMQRGTTQPPAQI